MAVPHTQHWLEMTAAWYIATSAMASSTLALGVETVGASSCGIV